MDPRQSKQGICNRHGIRIYPVPVYGQYKIEIEFNKSPNWEPRFQVEKPKRGSRYYDPKGKAWAEKIQELYEELYQTKVLPKLKRNEKKHSKPANQK